MVKQFSSRDPIKEPPDLDVTISLVSLITLIAGAIS